MIWAGSFNKEYTEDYNSYHRFFGDRVRVFRDCAVDSADHYKLDETSREDGCANANEATICGYTQYGTLQKPDQVKVSFRREMSQPMKFTTSPVRPEYADVARKLGESLKTCPLLF